ncbi:MAG: rod shape-determining protein RodA [Gammaproteobacteria bacterium]|nr:rod shape-determining protein RodA [Gammaproteobacteria bacterium]
MSRDFVRSMPSGSVLPAQRHLYQVHLDPLLLLGLTVIVGYGLLVLYSAVDENAEVFPNQLLRIALGFAALAAAAQLNPRLYLRWAPVTYAIGVLLLVAVLIVGTKVKGSQRWLDLPGMPRFQPSELMKIAVPLMLGWYFSERSLPPSFKHLAVASAFVLLPAGLIVLQPDLGTGMLVAMGGLAVIVLSGAHWRRIGAALAVAAAAAPALWFFGLRDYQRERVLTLFDAERDPLGAGWNIIQSKTAIGSGGVFGKGLFEGTQSHLEFLPESHTDFIIAVIGEELGLVGVTVLLLLYLVVMARGLFIATQAPDTFGRLVVGGLTLTFFIYVFVNIAMVCGLLPVVGVPLPLVSYGGTSAITLLAGFGIVMSIHTHRSW